VNYVCDLGLQQYDKKGILRYAWKFYEIYPTEIESIDFANDAAQDGDAIFVRAKVKFAYKNFLASGVVPLEEVQDRIEQMRIQSGLGGI
jgi:hypothetical protein